MKSLRLLEEGYGITAGLPISKRNIFVRASRFFENLGRQAISLAPPLERR
jgi:hypothetical protein